MNTKLHRKNPDGKKEDVLLPQITNPAKTVLFLEQGLPKEEKAIQAQPKYDGSCKGSAKSFVARYGGEGCLAFVDGHVQTVTGKEILTESAAFPLPQSDIVWTRNARGGSEQNELGAPLRGRLNTRERRKGSEIAVTVSVRW
jgi:hypothetical protein